MSVSRVVSMAVGAALLLALKPQDAATHSTESLTATQILERVAQVYASCKSYRDSGTVQDTPREPAEDSRPDAAAAAAGRRKLTPFRTAFVRPGMLHFEFSVDLLDINLDYATYRWIIGMDETGVRSWWDVEPGVRKPGSLKSALFDAGLWSKGSSFTIPLLLEPGRNDGPTFLERLTGAERLPDEKLGDATALVVTGSYFSKQRTVWVDAKTFLIRRIRDVADVNGTHIDKTTAYEPEIDVDIPSTELAFETPRVAVLPAAGASPGR
jgi:hypothetical protein